MKAEPIERMLCLLNVRLHALALCAVESSVRLRFPPIDPDEWSVIKQTLKQVASDYMPGKAKSDEPR